MLAAFERTTLSVADVDIQWKVERGPPVVPHDPVISRGSPFANVSDQKQNIFCDIPQSQSRQVRAQFKM
jgi:hypothetical protein